jgi:chromosome segregation ATPase
MEAAKWTFTSAQLQAIVSRAIRQSAEASSIRLLRLEILDNEIPEEMRRLESQRTDLKNRYKAWTRRRAALIDGLATYMNGGDEEVPAYALRMVEDLKDVTTMLDKFADELYSVDAQLAHLESITHVHTGSALSMALRKLNSSFLKQVAENQALRTQVQTLEAERDEAWQHAEDAASELDKMESLSSKRSSRISAKRKSSIRVSKAGLRTPSQRLSQLSSHGSSSHPFGTMPRSPMARSQKIPPVPAIPRRRPPDLSTDILNRSSV